MKTLAIGMMVATGMLASVPADATTTKAKKTSAAKAGNATKGKATYETYCFTCHGLTGKGDGPSAAGLPVKPRDHTDNAYMSTRTDAQLFEVTKKGGKSAGKSELMPAWGASLSDPQIRDVVAYVRTLHRPKK